MHCTYNGYIEKAINVIGMPEKVVLGEQFPRMYLGSRGSVHRLHPRWHASFAVPDVVVIQGAVIWSMSIQSTCI